MKKFVVAINPTTEEQSNQITNLFRGKYGWWHWIEGFWLVVDSGDTLTAKWIRDQLQEIAPNARTLVFEVTTPTRSWAGWGPSTPEKSMFKWIRETWFD